MDDEKYYQIVIEELRSASPREALWLKAITSNNGDEQKARIQYVKWRVDQLVEDERLAKKRERRDQGPPSTPAEKQIKRTVTILGLVLLAALVIFILCAVSYVVITNWR